MRPASVSNSKVRTTIATAKALNWRVSVCTGLRSEGRERPATETDMLPPLGLPRRPPRWREVLAHLTEPVQE
jgi:hypothetical protein